MSEFIPDLPEWLEVATKDLSLTAKRRIRLEIKSHFADAVEANLSEGATEAQARVFALADLGDAQAAAKRFRRSHLTTEEAKLLESTLRWNRSFWSIGLLYGFAPILAACGYYLLKKHHMPLLLPGISGVLFLTLATMAFQVARRGDFRSHVRLIFTLAALTWVSALMFFVFYGVWVSWELFISMLLGGSFGLVRNVRLWLKLRRISDVWQELPPPGAMAA